MLACLLAAGCSVSPTAPTSAAPTDPVAIVVGPGPFPAPVSETVTGTWYLGERRFMTVTQDGASVTGMPAPAIFDAGNGVTISESGLIRGVIDGNGVTLALTDRITVSGSGPVVICTASHLFTGVLAGSTLSGTMTAETTPFTCGAEVDMPAIELPVSGPTIFTRQ